MFQRRIIGLTSYYAGATKDYLSSKNIKSAEYKYDILSRRCDIIILKILR